MSNLKAIRDRIDSVKNTKKITEAMRLVAAAKVRRAQEQVTATRPFADALAQVLYGLQSRLRMEETDLPLLKQRDVNTVALLVITGDRGLCGSYNSSIIKKAEQRAAELKEQGLKYTFVIVGEKQFNISNVVMNLFLPNILVWSRFLLLRNQAKLPMNYFLYSSRIPLIG